MPTEIDMGILTLRIPKKLGASRECRTGEGVDCDIFRQPGHFVTSTRTAGGPGFLAIAVQSVRGAKGQCHRVEGRFETVLEMSGVREFRFHDLRHTFVSLVHPEDLGRPARGHPLYEGKGRMQRPATKTRESWAANPYCRTLRPAALR